jgi:hypothetical protein
MSLISFIVEERKERMVTVLLIAPMIQQYAIVADNRQAQLPRKHKFLAMTQHKISKLRHCLLIICQRCNKEITLSVYFGIHLLKPIAKTIPPLWFLNTIVKPIEKSANPLKL